VNAAIVAPQGWELPEDRGTIVAVGRLCDRTTYRVGDKVLFTPETGTSIKVDGVEYLLIRQRDLVAVIE
jgi:chaperonin GroES